MRKKGVLTSRDPKKPKVFAKDCKKILSINPRFFSGNIAFYLDQCLVHKTQLLSNALAPKGVFGGKNGGFKVTAKG